MSKNKRFKVVVGTSNVHAEENWVKVGPTRECVDGKYFGKCRTRTDWIASHIVNCFNQGWLAAIGGDAHCGRP